MQPDGLELEGSLADPQFQAVFNDHRPGVGRDQQVAAPAAGLQGQLHMSYGYNGCVIVDPAVLDRYLRGSHHRSRRLGDDVS
ncbi:MAG: hypothetical protein R6V75_11800, partial [Bacteroidales bacterium]